MPLLQIYLRLVKERGTLVLYKEVHASMRIQGLPGYL